MYFSFIRFYQLCIQQTLMGEKENAPFLRPSPWLQQPGTGGMNWMILRISVVPLKKEKFHSGIGEECSSPTCLILGQTDAIPYPAHQIVDKKVLGAHPVHSNGKNQAYLQLDMNRN